jgi:SAM-dependent methyltransferase
MSSTIIEFGCGNAKTPGAIGVDINPRSAADVLHDMNVFPYPFESSIADRIICHDVLEHVDHFIPTVEELWRIGKNGCHIEVTAPFMSSVNYHSDPTHRRAFTSRSFDYFIDGTEVHRHAYSTATLRLDSVAFDPLLLPLRKHFDRWLLKMANRHKKIYEERFAFIYPVHQIHFDLTVVK